MDVGVKEGDQPAVPQYLQSNKEQLWAEALAEYGSGTPWNLPSDVLSERDARNSKAEKQDVILQEAIEPLKPNSTEKGRTPSPT